MSLPDRTITFVRSIAPFGFFVQVRTGPEAKSCGPQDARVSFCMGLSRPAPAAETTKDYATVGSAKLGESGSPEQAVSLDFTVFGPTRQEALHENDKNRERDGRKRVLQMQVAEETPHRISLHRTQAPRHAEERVVVNAVEAQKSERQVVRHGLVRESEEVRRTLVRDVQRAGRVAYPTAVLAVRNAAQIVAFLLRSSFTSLHFA